MATVSPTLSMASHEAIQHNKNGNNSLIHPFTVIHPNSRIASDVQIGAFTTIEEDVEIESGTWVGSNVTLMKGTRIGKNCRIFPGAVIGAIPQDLKFKGEYTLAIVGDNTTVRECVTINRGTEDKGKTEIGKNCLLMAYVHIAHDCIVGNNCIIANAVQMAGHVEVGDFAVIGGASAILQFVKIGTHTMTAGCSQVRKDIPPYVRAAREPISYSGLNIVGLRRRGFTAQQIGELQEIYRRIFNAGMNVSAAIKNIQETMPESIYKEEILSFIASSKKGIIKGGTDEKQD